MRCSADRETIVFDFRPRAGFKPKNREESLIAKLIGVVWIDPVDKQVIRLEARLAEGFQDGRRVAGFAEAGRGAGDGADADGRRVFGCRSLRRSICRLRFCCLVVAITTRRSSGVSTGISRVM